MYRIKTEKDSYFSCMIAILPILSEYSFKFFSGLDIGTIAICLYFVFTSVKSKKLRLSLKNSFFPLFLYTLCFTPFSLFLIQAPFKIDTLSVILRYGKYIIVLGMIICFTRREWFSFQKFIKVVRLVVYSTFFLILIQQLSYYFLGIIIPNPMLYLFSISGGSEMKAGYVVIANGLLRPSAIFVEPSWMGVYFIAYLSYILFTKNKKVIWDILITIIGMVLTTSSLAFLAVGALLIAYIIKEKKEKMLFLISAIIPVLYLVCQTPIFKGALERLINNPNVIEGRTGNGYELWESFSFFQKCFGLGFGRVPVGQFLNGLEYILVTNGIIGCMILFMICIRIFYKGVSFQKIVILCYIILLIGVQVYNVSTIVYYFAFACNLGFLNWNDGKELV